MQALAQKFYSEEEYWAFEEHSSIKHEYWDGEIVAMSGGTATHSLMAMRIGASLTNQLRGKPCRAFGSDLRVKVQKSRKNFNTYPDISIACPPFEFEEKRSGVKDTLLNPRVLIEVLSPSTEKFDRADKFDQYKLIESLTDYILVAQDRVRIEHYHRGEGQLWTVQSFNQRADSFALPELEILLSLEEIYEGLDVPEGLILLPDDDSDA